MTAARARNTQASLPARALVAVVLLAALAGTEAARAACPPAPSPRCRVAQRDTVDIRQSASDPSRSMLRWKWTKGAPTLAGGFGLSPAVDDALCVYDAGGL